MFHVEHSSDQVVKIVRGCIRMSAQSVNHIRYWFITTTLAVFILVNIGCSRPNPTPELTDPIFSDLTQRFAVAKAAADSKKGEIKKLRAELEALPARDVARKKTQEDITKQEHLMMAAEQEALYFEIRANQRKAYARDEYIKAFEKGKPWPDPKDFETYKLQRKLRDSPRDWSSKLPKPDRYNKKSVAEIRKDIEEKQKKADAGGGGAHH